MVHDLSIGIERANSSVEGGSTFSVIELWSKEIKVRTVVDASYSLWCISENHGHRISNLSALSGTTHSVFKLCSKKRYIGKSTVSVNHDDSKTHH